MGKIVFILLIFSIQLNAQLIINHTHVDLYDDIPANFIDSVKTKWLVYPGRSHAQAFQSGLNGLESLDGTYDVNVTGSGTPEAYTTAHLRMSASTWGNFESTGLWYYDYYWPYDCWTNAAGIAQTEVMLDYCDANIPLDYFFFGWSWDGVNTSTSSSEDPVFYVRWYGESPNGPDGDLPWGLDDGDLTQTGNHLSMLDYCTAIHNYNDYIKTNGYKTKYGYSTLPIDDAEYSFGSGEVGYQAYLKNEYIRNYVDTIADAILFDYADILAYNNSNVEQTTTWTDGNSVLQTFPIIHDDNMGGSFTGHIGSVGALRLAKALWVMMAMDAGWTIPVASDTTNYYISNTGNDANSGHHPDSAIATIAELNTRTLEPGDTVFFEANGIWREEMDVTASGTRGNPIVYTRYGSGLNPKIVGSELLSGWTVYSGNVWQCTPGGLSTPQGRNSAEGSLYAVDGIDSVTHYNERQTSLGAVNTDGEWYYSGGVVYLYSSTDPDTRWASVELSQRNTCMTMANDNEQDWLTVDGVDLKFAINAGFSSGYPGIGGHKGLVFRNCYIGYIGVKASGYAYGIEMFHDSSMVEHCKITDCGRRGISVNMYVTQTSGQEIFITNLIIRYNHFKRGYHTTSLDCSTQLSNSDQVSGVYFYGNVIDDSELTNFTSSERSNQLFVQLGGGTSYMNNFYITGNVFIGATSRSILLEGVDTSYIYNNTIAGFNQWMPDATYSPFANVSYTLAGANAYYANNILYDDLGQIPLDNHGVYMSYEQAGGGLGTFELKDYNLYYSLYPGYDGDRNFSYHRPNSLGTSDGWWATDEWSTYLSDNSTAGYENHSPTPQDPNFVSYAGKDFHLNEASAANGTGMVLPFVEIIDPEGVHDTINKRDFDRKLFGSFPPMGAYAFSAASVPASRTPVKRGNIVNGVSRSKFTFGVKRKSEF